MPVIANRHRGRNEGGDRILRSVAGAINVTARVGSYPAGSLGLNHVSAIILSASSAVSNATRRSVVGSVRDPETTFRNSVLLRAIVTGTTGTRNASGATTIGSTLGAGTSATAHFIAYGW